MKLAELIRRAIALAEPTGTLTFDQLNELVPPDQTDPEDIEALMSALSDADIQLADD